MSKIRLGIDFGSTYTYIYSIDESVDKIDRNINDHRDSGLYEGRAGIPTLLGTDKNENTVVGINAVNCYTYEDVSLKDRLRDLFNNSSDDDTVVDDITTFFRVLIEGIGINTRDVCSVVCGIPASTPIDWQSTDETGMTQSIYITNMEEIFNNVFGNNSGHIDCKFIEEPVLAYLGARKKGLINDEGDILVVDLGGGTNDFAYITNDGSGKPIVKVSPLGGKGPAGKEIDNCIKTAVIDAFKDYYVFDKDKIKNSIKRAKEYVFGDGKNYRTGTIPAKDKNDHEKDVDINLMYGNSAGESVFDMKKCQMLKGKFSSIAKRVIQFCEECANAPEIKNFTNFKYVLFVGGCSRIYPLTELIESELNKYMSQYGCNPEYIHIKESKEDQNSPIGEVTLNNSNAVAYGALFYDEIEFGSGAGRVNVEGWQFGIHDKWIDLKFKDEPDFSGGYSCWFTVGYDIESNYQNTNKDKHTIQFLEKDSEGIKNIPIYDSDRINAPEPDHSWLVNLGKKKCMYFKLKHGKTNIPVHTPYHIKLPDEINDIRLIFTYTKNRHMWIFIFARDGDNNEFDLIKNIDIDQTYIYGIMVKQELDDASTDVIEGKEVKGRREKLSNEKKYNFLKEYQNGNK